jgi:O-antigen/teichoic acid export membrane protein
VRSARVLLNIVTSILRFFVSGVLGLLLTRVMVHGLGDASYGLWVAVFALTGYFGLFDQGVRPSLVRYLSRDHARGDVPGMSRTLSSALALGAAIGVLVMLVTVAVAALLGRWLHHLTPDQIETGRAIVLIAGTSVAVGFPLGVFGAALSGLQRYDLANGIGIAVSLLRFLAFVAVIRGGGGLVGLAWASLAMNLLGHVVSLIWVLRLIPGLELRRAHVSRESLRLIGVYGGLAFLGALAASITFQTDALVITAFLGTALVTPFAFAANPVEYARSFVYTATQVLAPTASEFETRGEQEKLHHMVLAGAKYSVLVSWPVLAGLLIFGRNFLVTWVGERYASAYPLLVVLTVPTFLSLPQSASAAVLYGVSRHRGVVVLSLLNAALNLGLSLLWVRPYGLMGVAAGTAIPLVAIFGVGMAIFTCRALALSARRYLIEGMVKPGLASLAFVAPALLVQWRWHPVGWGPLALATGGCWIVFAAVTWRIGLGQADRGRWARTFAGLRGARAGA